jgi:hypothetical protein
MYAQFIGDPSETVNSPACRHVGVFNQRPAFESGSTAKYHLITYLVRVDLSGFGGNRCAELTLLIRHGLHDKKRHE